MDENKGSQWQEKIAGIIIEELIKQEGKELAWQESAHRIARALLEQMPYLVKGGDSEKG